MQSLVWSDSWQPLVRSVLTLVVVFLASRIVEWIWFRVLLRYTERTRVTFDRELVLGTKKPVRWVVVVAGLWIGLMDYAGLRVLLDGRFELWVDRIFYAVLVWFLAGVLYRTLDVLVGWYRSAIAEKTSTDLDDTFVSLFESVGKVIIYFLAIMMILNRWEQPITTFLATAGVASLAVAFAAQETLANMIAGFTIMVDRPFRVGDRVELADGILGDVLSIGLRTTKVLSFDNTVIVIPNQQIAGARVINHNYPDPKVKVRPTVGVAYGTDIDRAKEIVRQACVDHPLVLKEPEPSVYFTEFGDSSLNLMGICWVGDYRDKFQTLDDILRDIYRRFAAEGIEIPFPQRDVHLYNHTPPEEIR